jgi:hypothetical protein
MPPKAMSFVVVFIRTLLFEPANIADARKATGKADRLS